MQTIFLNKINQLLLHNTLLLHSNPFTLYHIHLTSRLLSLNLTLQLPLLTPPSPQMKSFNLKADLTKLRLRLSILIN